MTDIWITLYQFRTTADSTIYENNWGDVTIEFELDGWESQYSIDAALWWDDDRRAEEVRIIESKAHIDYIRERAQS